MSHDRKSRDRSELRALIHPTRTYTYTEHPFMHRTENGPTTAIRELPLRLPVIYRRNETRPKRKRRMRCGYWSSAWRVNRFALLAPTRHFISADSQISFQVNGRAPTSRVKRSPPFVGDATARITNSLDFQHNSVWIAVFSDAADAAISDFPNSHPQLWLMIALTLARTRKCDSAEKRVLTQRNFFNIARNFDMSFQQERAWRARDLCLLARRRRGLRARNVMARSGDRGGGHETVCGRGDTGN